MAAQSLQSLLVNAAVRRASDCIYNHLLESDKSARQGRPEMSCERSAMQPESIVQSR